MSSGAQTFALGPGQRSWDVVVLGGGIVGLSTAFFLGRLGLRTLVIERNATPVLETSARSGEGIRAQWERPHNIRMMTSALELYERFGELVGVSGATAGLRRIGYAYVTATEKGENDLLRRAERQIAAGLEGLEILSGREIVRQLPHLAPGLRLALLRRDDGILSVDRIVDGYLRSRAFQILTGTRAIGLSVESGRVHGVKTDQGDVAAGAVVVSLGPWTRKWLADTGAPPMALVQGTIVRVEVPGIPAEHPATIDVDRGSFWRPDVGGGRITAPLQAPTARFDPDQSIVEDEGYLARAIANVAPASPVWQGAAGRVRSCRVISGYYPVTPDGSPVIGRLPIDGLHIHCGYGGHGIMGSVDGARRLAALFAGGTDVDDAAFSPDRFRRVEPTLGEPMTVNVSGHEKAWFGAAEGNDENG